MILDPQREGLSSATSARVAGIVFLSRRSGARAAWEDFSQNDALRYFKKYVHWGNPAVQGAAYEAILSGGARALVYQQLDDAIARLDELLRELPA